VFIHHGWEKESSDFNHDIAIIKLSNQAATIGLSLWQDSGMTRVYMQGQIYLMVMALFLI